MVESAARRLEALDLEPRTLERARETAHLHLNGRKLLMRDELLAAFARAKISVAGQRGYHMLWFLAQTGTLCFGPPRDNEQSFVLLEEWAKRPRRLAGDEALGEIARRYFVSHGRGRSHVFSRQGRSGSARHLAEGSGRARRGASGIR